MTPEISEAIAKDLVKAVRGRRSQAEFSRRIRYRSNIAQRWESGDCWPTAAAFLSACLLVKPQCARSFHQFFGRLPDWFDPEAPFAPASIASFLRELRGKTPIGELVRRTGYNRYSIGRWLKGNAQPKLPEFLCLIEAASRRLADFVATLVDPTTMPTLSKRWQQLQRACEAAYEHPWSHAVLRALELKATFSSTRRSRWEWLFATRLSGRRRDVLALRWTDALGRGGDQEGCRRQGCRRQRLLAKHGLAPRPPPEPVFAPLGQLRLPFA